MLKPTQEQIELVAAAIANARGGRRGMPSVEMLAGAAPTLHAEVMEDAEAALEVVFAQFENNPSERRTG